MKCIINVGGTGSGKSARTKEILASLSGKPFFINDVNYEYKEYGRYAKQGLTPTEFKTQSQKLKGHVIVYEEASMMFKHSNQDEETTRLLVQKRHTNNFLIFNFHSLRMVPLWIMDYCDYLILHQTTDNPKNIETKFGDYEKVYEAFNDIHDTVNYVVENKDLFPVPTSMNFSNGVKFKRLIDKINIERFLFEKFVKLR